MRVRAHTLTPLLPLLPRWSRLPPLTLFWLPNIDPGRFVGLSKATKKAIKRTRMRLFAEWELDHLPVASRGMSLQVPAVHVPLCMSKPKRCAKAWKRIVALHQAKVSQHESFV